MNGRRVPIAFLPSARARRITVRADPAKARITVSYPRGGSKRLARRFLEEKRDWLAACVARWPEQACFRHGLIIPLEGHLVAIVHIQGARRTPELQQVGERWELRVGGPAEMLAGRVERWLKARARAVLTQDTHACAASYGLGDRVARISVRDTSSRWGSCNAALGTFNYNWRLICAPPLVRRAVVAHEVAHLVHRGHGAAFHALADDLADGTQTQADAWLRAEGAALHRIGR